jgi:hypothetical protein
VEYRQFDKNVDDASSAVGTSDSISLRTEIIAEGLTAKEVKNRRDPVHDPQKRIAELQISRLARSWAILGILFLQTDTLAIPNLRFQIPD